MPVQIAPLQPSNLAQVALAARSAKRQDRQLDQADRRIELQDLLLQSRNAQGNAQLEIQQERLGLQRQAGARQQTQLNAEQAARADALVPQALSEAIDTASKAPAGQKVRTFRAIIDPILAKAQESGRDYSEMIASFENYTESDFGPNAAQVFQQSANKQAAAQKGASGRFRRADGSEGIGTVVFDPNAGGSTRIDFAEGGGDFLSPLGETAGEQSQRKILEAGDKASATGQAKRQQEFISAGLDAADGIGSVKRAIDLLDAGVKSGGFTPQQFAAARRFGVENPEQGELSFLLGKAVLSQLKATFGAAFTAAEGDRLERIEANLGNSPQTNLRLLNRTFETLERAARRGIEVAKAEGDDFSAREMELLLQEAREGLNREADPLEEKRARAKAKLNGGN